MHTRLVEADAADGDECVRQRESKWEEANGIEGREDLAGDAKCMIHALRIWYAHVYGICTEGRENLTVSAEGEANVSEGGSVWGVDGWGVQFGGGGFVGGRGWGLVTRSV